MSTEETPQVLRHASVYVAWAFAFVFVVAVILLVPAERQLAALGLCLGLTSLVAFVAQVIVAEKAGLVIRLSLSLLGALIIVAAATLTVSVVLAR